MSIISVPISKLDFDLQNPRYPVQMSQREAWEKILISNTSKSVRLAEHIVKFGQNPIDIVAVVETEDKRFLVLEGNRRAAVLRALNKPQMLDSIPSAAGIPAFIKRMKHLAKAAQAAEINKATVYVFISREQADTWIQLKHTGENDGAGTVMWDGSARARYRNKGDIGLELLDFGRANNWFSEDDLTQNGPFPITTLNRLLGDPAVRTALGLELSNGALLSTVEPAELSKAVTQVVSDLVNGKAKNGKWNVTTLKLKGDRKRYLDQLPAASLPAGVGSRTPWQIDADTAVPPQQKPLAGPKVRVRNAARASLIPKDFVVNTSPSSPRLSKLFKELKQLPVDKFENAVSVLLRTTIELSLDDLIARGKVYVSTKGKQATLAEKAKAAALHFKNQGLLDKNQDGIVQRLVSIDDNARADSTSIFTLHSFIHSRHASPIPSELKTIWDTIAPFMRLVAHV
jgi:hypothetical protein